MKLNEVNIGNINVALLDSQEELIEYLVQTYKREQFATLTAINPEKVMIAMKNHDVLSTIQNSSVRYADGIGIVMAIKHKFGISTTRVPGCEAWENLMAQARERQLPVYLVGAKGFVLSETKKQLIERYNTPIVGATDGYFSDEDELIENIKQSGAAIVTVALGSPKQEQFIARCRKAGIKAIFMGVGGSYDAFIGNVKRAPEAWRKLGLEWLYRILQQPSRLGRQLNLVKFAYMMLTNKL